VKAGTRDKWRAGEPATVTCPRCQLASGLNDWRWTGDSPRLFRPGRRRRRRPPEVGRVRRQAAGQAAGRAAPELVIRRAKSDWSAGGHSAASSRARAGVGSAPAATSPAVPSWETDTGPMVMRRLLGGSRIRAATSVSSAGSSAARRPSSIIARPRRRTDSAAHGTMASSSAVSSFCITPFNRRWHAAACPHVQTMTVGTPKWFAARPAELADYLQARITQYDTAKPIDACPACVPE